MTSESWKERYARIQERRRRRAAGIPVRHLDRPVEHVHDKAQPTDPAPEYRDWGEDV